MFLVGLVISGRKRKQKGKEMNIRDIIERKCNKIVNSSWLDNVERFILDKPIVFRPINIIVKHKKITKEEINKQPPKE